MSQVLNIQNHMPSLANQIYHHSINRYHNNVYRPNTLPVPKKTSLQELLPFQSQTTQQEQLNFPQKSLLNNPQHPSCSYNHSNNPYQQSFPILQPVFTILFYLPTCSQNHLYNPHQHSFPLYISHFAPHYFNIEPSLQSSLKILSNTSAIQPIYAV